MMTLTALMTALVALVPAKPRWLWQENDRLARSHGRLIDHIERLERELLIERHLSTHWKEQAARHAVEARQEREAHDRTREQKLGLAVRLLAHQPRQGRQAQANAQAAYGFCDCAPGRSQLWAADQSQFQDGDD
jgi:hypothetical protein